MENATKWRLKIIKKILNLLICTSIIFSSQNNHSYTLNIKNWDAKNILSPTKPLFNSKSAKKFLKTASLAATGAIAVLTVYFLIKKIKSRQQQLGYITIDTTNTELPFRKKYNIKIDGKNKSTNLPIHKACFENDEKKVKELIDNGTDIQDKDQWGNTPLHIACLGYNEKIVKYLVDSGAKVKDKNYWGDTPLHRTNNPKIIEYFLNNGAKINDKNYYGKTPLHLAGSRTNIKAVKCFVENGADINDKDFNGNTILHEICYKIENHDIQTQSIKKINQKIKKYRIDIANYLINNGANISAKNKLGQTPIDIAYENHFDEMIKNFQTTNINTEKEFLNSITNTSIEKIKKGMNSNNITPYTKQSALETLIKTYNNEKNKKINNQLATKYEIKNFFKKIYFNTRFFTDPKLKNVVKFAAENNCIDTKKNSVIRACTLYCRDKNVIENTISRALTVNSSIYNHINTKSFKKLFKNIDQEENLEEIQVISKTLKFARKKNREVYKQLLNRLELLSTIKNLKHNGKNIPNPVCAKMVGLVGYNNYEHKKSRWQTMQNTFHTLLRKLKKITN